MNANTERQSAPTGASNPDCKQEANRPLGDAACCASVFRDKLLKYMRQSETRGGSGDDDDVLHPRKHRMTTLLMVEEILRLAQAVQQLEQSCAWERCFFLFCC